MQGPDRPTVQRLCRAAIDGELTFDGLNDAWPRGSGTSPLLERVREDIKSAIEHFPGLRMWDRWCADIEHKNLIGCLALLDMSLTDEELLPLYESMIRLVDDTTLSGDHLRLYVLRHLRDSSPTDTH